MNATRILTIVVRTPRAATVMVHLNARAIWVMKAMENNVQTLMSAQQEVQISAQQMPIAQIRQDLTFVSAKKASEETEKYASISKNAQQMRTHVMRILNVSIP